MSQFTTFVKQNSKDEPTLWTFRGETFILSDDSEHITPLSGNQEPLTYTAFRKQYLSEYVRLPRVIPKDAACRDLFFNLSPSKRAVIEAYRRRYLYYKNNDPIIAEAPALLKLYEYFFTKNIDGTISRTWRAYSEAFVGYSTQEYLKLQAASAFALYGPFYEFAREVVRKNSALTISSSEACTAVNIIAFGAADLTTRGEEAARDAAREYLKVPKEARDKTLADRAFFSRLYYRDGVGLSLTQPTRQVLTAAYERFLGESILSDDAADKFFLYLDTPSTQSFLSPQTALFRHDDWVEMPYTLTSAAQEQRQNNADAANFEVYLRVYPQLPDKPFPTELLNSLCPNSARTYKKWEELGYIAAVGRDPKTYKKLWRKIYDPFIIDAPGEDD